MSDGPVKRSYVAPARRAAALATRDRICASAEDLFIAGGYARTSIRAVAKAAGVSEATVYLAFGTKAALLDAVILRAIRDSGSDGLDATLASPAPAVLAQACKANAVLMRRAARIIALGESAAIMDAELRPLRERAHRGIRAMLRAIADRLDEAGLLAPGVTASAAADTMYAVATETTYLRFVDGGRHTPDDYAAWLTTTLEAALLAPRS